MALSDQSTDRADFPCPSCDNFDVVRSNGNMFRCQNCGQDTHEKVGQNADTLKDLSDSDLPVSGIASVLLGRR